MGYRRRGGFNPGVIAVVVIVIVVLAGASGLFNGRSITSPGGGITVNLGEPTSVGGSLNSAINPVNPGSYSVANQPPVVQTQTAVDLADLHNAFDRRIPTWQGQLANNVEMHISPFDVGLASSNNIADVVYGKCNSDFYIFVIYKGALPSTDTSGANRGGYMYTSASNPLLCRSLQYTVVNYENDGGGWYFTYFKA